MHANRSLIGLCFAIGAQGLFGQLAPAPSGADTAAEARLVNLSTRARVAADNPLITGFAINGTNPRTVLVRAAGPGLAAFGVPGVVAAPHLRLHDASGAVILENSGWGDSTALGKVFLATGAFPFAQGSADAAAVVTLAPGSYSVEVLDDSGRGGVALAEIYDAQGTAAGSHLVNVSTYGTVSAGGGELISGFVLAGNAPRQFLVRGVGPALAKFGMKNTLSDPVLAVFNSTGAQIAGNNNWSGPFAVMLSPANGGTFYDTISLSNPFVAKSPASSTAAAPLIAAATATGAFALDFASNDAALVTTLAPGAYTVQVTGARVQVIPPIPPTISSLDNITAQTTFVPPAPGVALLEIYELP